MNEVSAIEFDGFASRVVVKDEHAFVLDTNYGFYVINVTDKMNPFIQGSYQLNNPTALDIVGSYIYVAIDEQVKIIQVFE